LLDAAPVALLHVDAHGMLQRVNRAARLLCGSDAVPGLPLHALWAPAQGTPDRSAGLCAAAPQRRVLELAGAEPRWVQAHSNPLEGGGWMLSLQPADARADGEAESQLALAVDLGEIAIWRHDLATQRMHYNVQAWKVLDMAPRPEGLDIAEVRELIHPDDLPQVLETARLALESDTPTDMEARYRRRDGAWREVMTRRVVQRDAQGRPVAFLGVALDITARRAQQQQQQDAALALRSAVERVALAAGGVGLGTWEVDLDGGQVYWDAQMWRLRGHEPQPRAMSQGERMACVHPEDRAATYAVLDRAMVDGLPFENEFRVVWPDGQVRWLASRSVEIRDAATRGRRRIGVNWDVTDKRTGEAARREREIALRENQAKSKFLARMSHELRTPLNAVLGFSQLLLADGPGSDEHATARHRWLEHIHTAGQHLLALINDVLDLSSLEGGEMAIEMQPVELAPLLEQTLPLLGTLAEQRRVSVTVGALQAQVMADPMRLRQVLLNLLTNAVKYNRTGGSVTVEALPRGTEVLLRVADTGRGMNDEQLRHLFEPFNRLGRESDVRDPVDGSGIGLAIAKALIERMGGSVHVDSAPGAGSVFELRLAAANALQAPAAPVADARRRQVLYVEDNPVNALIIGELLARREDITLHIAVDGGCGVARAVELRPDLVLLDMQLPDFDGFEVLRRLRADPRTASIPCVALSANAMPDDIDRALRAGVAHYWTKPLDFQAFLASLDTMFGAPGVPGAPVRPPPAP